MKKKSFFPCFLTPLLAAAILWIGALPGQAALNVYLQMTLNSEPIDGDVSIDSIGGVDVTTDHIEVYGVNHEIFGSATRLTHTPFKVIKRVDKSTPDLYKALSGAGEISATFKYFNNDLDDGSTRLYSTITLNNARITGIRHWSPNNLDPIGTAYPHMEEVSFEYESITYTDEINNVSHAIETAP